VPLHDLDLAQPVALVFGNEHRGISDEAAEQADGTFIIPMFGMVQSLNVSVATAVTVYEAVRQRLRAGLYAQPRLEAAEFDLLLAEWMRR
jgi:tRNA (guanosine-2'-O-)-methyltransferase